MVIFLVIIVIFVQPPKRLHQAAITHIHRQFFLQQYLLNLAPVLIGVAAKAKSNNLALSPSRQCIGNAGDCLFDVILAARRLYMFVDAAAIRRLVIQARLYDVIFVSVLAQRCLVQRLAVPARQLRDNATAAASGTTSWL